MRIFASVIRDLFRYPGALIGVLLILGLIGVSVYTVIAMPYAEAIRLWRGGEAVWQENPRLAMPIWMNYIRGTNAPQTIALDSRVDGAQGHVQGTVQKSSQAITDEMTEVNITFDFNYPYDGFPQELTVFIQAQFDEKRPHVSFVWLTPDGREIRVGEITARASETYRISQDDRLQRRLRGAIPHRAMFAQPPTDDDDAGALIPQQGEYQLQMTAILFEPEGDIDAKLVAYGQVHGWTGTDHRRRDMSVALLWGTPIALAFGLLAAVGSTVTTMIIAAIGVWFGRWIDAAIQRITEVNLILPVLPVLVMIGTFYSRSIWVMLTAVIILGIFSAGIKTYRAIFLQVKESPYIEAAQAYGAGHMRIVFRYMIPRIIPILIPQFVVLIPSFVFLEATLAVLGLGDPVLPTWGKVLDDARSNGALYHGHYYWMLQPAALLMVTGLGFAMVGFTLDRIFNPRLRGL
jgi:peptide/nickel transport system permease protein